MTSHYKSNIYNKPLSLQSELVVVFFIVKKSFNANIYDGVNEIQSLNSQSLELI